MNYGCGISSDSFSTADLRYKRIESMLLIKNFATEKHGKTRKNSFRAFCVILWLLRGNAEVKSAIGDIQKHQSALIKQAQNIEQLMGYESQARQSYYETWAWLNPLLKITKRTKRPPTDRINCLISFCNGLVYSVCKNELSKTHLDLTLSFIHAPTQARASLSLDLAEIFKPVIADKLIFGLINRNMLEDKDFEESEGMCLLSETGRRKVVEGFREKMDRETIEALRGWRAVILREAFKIQAHVLGLEKYEPYTHKVLTSST